MRSATVAPIVPRRSTRHMKRRGRWDSSSPRKRKRALAASWKLFCPSHRRARRSSQYAPSRQPSRIRLRTSNVRRATAASSRSRSACSWRCRRRRRRRGDVSSGRSSEGGSAQGFDASVWRSLLPSRCEGVLTRWCRPTSMRRARESDGQAPTSSRCARRRETRAVTVVSIPPIAAGIAKDGKQHPLRELRPQECDAGSFRPWPTSQG